MASIEADSGHEAAAWGAIGADERFSELSTVPSQAAGQRHVRADGPGDPGNQLAAVHVEAVRQDEDARQIISLELSGDRFAATTRVFRVLKRFGSQAQPGRVKPH